VVYSGWDSSLLNMRVKFFLTNYLLYDFLLRGGGEVPLERRNIFLTPLSTCCRIGCIQSEVVCSHIYVWAIMFLFEEKSNGLCSHRISLLRLEYH